MASRRRGAVKTAPLQEILAAIESYDPEAPWAEAAAALRVALPRRRPLPPGTGELPTRTYPPGIEVSLAIDLGPAVSFVTADQLRVWGVGAKTAFDRALDNVRIRLRDVAHIDVLHDRIGQVPTCAFESREGWASVLLLLPDDLCTVLGTREGLILAPMRDLILSMPLETDPALARALLEEFAAVDPNALDVPVLALVDGALSQIDVVPALGDGRFVMH